MTKRSEHPLTEYQRHLREYGLSETTVRVYLSSMRRLFSTLSEEDCLNPQMLAYYRASLSSGMRGALGVAWRHYREFAKRNGVTDFPEFVNMPQFRLPHPLYPDVVDLAAMWPLDKAARVTWNDLRKEDPTFLRLFERIEQFHGEPHTLDIAPACMYPPWVLEHILRSADTITDHHGIEAAMLHVYEVASRMNAPIIDMRTLYAICMEKRTALVRWNKAGENILACVHDDWPSTFDHLKLYLRGDKPLLVERPEGRRNVLFW